MPGFIHEGIDPLDSLESQIEELEKRILGTCEVSLKEPQIIESLVQSNTTINNAVSSHSSIKTLFDRLDQLGTFLDPSFEDSLVDVACKKKVVLESENDLKQYLLQSKKLCELNNILNGEPFKKVPALVESLRKLSDETIKLQSACDNLKTDVEEISVTFTNTVKTVTQSFLFFETQLAELEEKSKKASMKDISVED